LLVEHCDSHDIILQKHVIALTHNALALRRAGAPAEVRPATAIG
jgi:hypothetical protein